MAIKKITVPDLGDATEVEVIELLVSVGQDVKENDSLLVLESDKAAMEIPAPMTGTVTSIAVNLGDQVTTGSEMLSLDIKGSEEVESSENIENSEEANLDEQAELAKNSLDKPEVRESPKEKEPKKSESSDSTKISTSLTIEVPDLGTDDEVDVIELHIKVGDFVGLDDPLVTLESDKAAMDVPAPHEGKIQELLIKLGDKVKTGSLIAVIKSVKEEQLESSSTEPEVKVDDANPEKPALAEPAENSLGRTEDSIESSLPSSGVYAGPAVRKLARELGVDLGAVNGTGAKNRIIKEDIHEYVKGRLNKPVSGGLVPVAVPDIDFSQFGDVEKVERSKLAKITAVNMHRNWTAVPHVAQFNEADVTDLETFMSELKAESEDKGIKLTFLPFLLKACEKALKEFPQFNVSLHSSGEYLIQKKYFHIGVAMATDAGLVVPVIKNVDQKSIWDLASEVVELNAKAKGRKLGVKEMQGACFTISSLGAVGGTGFIPIINTPEVAILGVARTEMKPLYMDGEFKPRKMLPFTLSYDHKVLNGIDGGLFSTYLARILADVRYLTL